MDKPSETSCPPQNGYDAEVKELELKEKKSLTLTTLLSKDKALPARFQRKSKTKQPMCLFPKQSKAVTHHVVRWRLRV